MGASKAPSYYILLGTNALAIIVALVILGIALDIMYGPGVSALSSINGLPVQIYYVVVAFSLFVFIISLLGVIGSCLRSKVATILYIILDLLLAVAILIIMIFVLLYANGKSTTPLIDNSIKSIQTGLETELLTQAIHFNATWAATQTGFKCCGIDLQSTYDFETYKETDADFIEQLQPGDACATLRDDIAWIHSEYANYTDAEPNVPANVTASFCKEVISADVQANTKVIGGISGLLVFLMLVTGAAAIRLLSKVTVSQGGFVPDPQDSVSGGSLAVGGPQTNQVSGGTNYT